MSTSITSPRRLREAEDALGARVARVAPESPLVGPLRLQVRFCWPTGASHRQGEPMRSKPDADNLLKTFQDVLARCRVIADDKDVVDLSVAKAWADPTGIWFRVEKL